jgi:hypothetical protein
MLASLDGHIVIRRRARGDDPERTGRELAASMVEIDAAGELFGLA